MAKTTMPQRRSCFARPLPAVLAVLVLVALTFDDSTATSNVRCRVEPTKVTITLESSAYRLIDASNGQRLEAGDFGHLQIPGAPALPLKRFLVALPPGTRARSVEIVNATTVALPGSYELAPSPPIMPLPGMLRWEKAARRFQEEWRAEREEIYGSNAPFPHEAVWLTGGGTLRKYAYASVAVCPFTYRPQSGQLEHHAEIEFVIHCEPIPVDDPALQRLTMQDQAADGEAAGLFVNYSEIASLYDAIPPDVPNRTETNDYVIVTTESLEAAISVSTFPAWKAARGHTLRTVLITDDEIASQPGIDLAEQIRNFLRAYYAVWGIEHVLLVGDYATVPMRVCYPDPNFHVYNPWDPGLVAPGTPTDYYYADLSFSDDMSWDSDQDGYHGEYGQDAPDFLAEVAVGRIPVNHSGRITYTLDKLVAFEQDTGPWKGNVLHGGSILFFENQNYGGGPFIDGATCLDSIETALMSGLTITHFTERAGLVTSLCDWPAISEASFTSSWSSGQHAVVNWSGHGWPDGAYRTIWAWDDGDGVPESGNGELQSHRFIGLGSGGLDDDHPSIVFAISCNVGYPDPNPFGNLGIDLLTEPGWGASAGIVSSSRPAAISGDWKSDPGGTEQICYEFNRHLLVESASVGEALYRGKFDATTSCGWDHLYEYMNLYNFNLYGDPALALARETVGAPEVADVTPSWNGRPVTTPNPFRATTSFSVLVPSPGTVRASVIDLTGRHVTTLLEGHHEAGEIRVHWDGTREDGVPVGSGAYSIVVEVGGKRTIRKVVLLR